MAAAIRAPDSLLTVGGKAAVKARAPLPSQAHCLYEQWDAWDLRFVPVIYRDRKSHGCIIRCLRTQCNFDTKQILLSLSGETEKVIKDIIP